MNMFGSGSDRACYARHDGDTLTIGNHWLERGFAARRGSPFITATLVNKISNRNYWRSGGREFCFSAEGRELSGTDFALADIEINDQRDPCKVIARLRSSGLRVELHYLVYANHPVVRKWLVIENAGDRAIALTNLDWEEVHLLVDTSATAEVWADYFSQRVKSIVVTMDDCALLVNDPTHGEGFIVATEAPGPMKRLAVYSQPTRIAVGYNRDDETIFERVLAPGERFQTHASFILTFSHPVPQDVIDDTYARFVAEHLTACDVTQVPAITVNTWEPHGVNLHRELLIEQMEIAADLGVDAYQVDDGWYERKGDWNVDQKKFPNGLEEIAEYARRRGMRFGLWMAVPTVEPGSRVLTEHPDWLARDREGNPHFHSRPNNLTMCLDSPFADYIHQKIDSIIRRYGVELLKLDLSSARNIYVPYRYHGCFATNHAHRTPNESHLRILERLFDIIRALKRDHPQCLIDLSFELYGVVDGTDLALTQAADQNWFTNITSPNEINLRREVYQRGRVTRPWTLNLGGTHLDHPNAPHYGIFSTFTSHAGFWGDLVKIDAATRAHYRRWFAWLKTQRAQDDFYRYYQVSDIFPVPDGLSARDYRRAIPTARYGIESRGIHPPAFGPAQEHAGEFWDGVARLNADGEGPIFLFRPAGSRDDSFQLRLPWVRREERYRIHDEMAERDLGIFLGTVLIETGIRVTIETPARAKVLVVKRMDE